jgi:hypothetical protein
MELREPWKTVFMENLNNEPNQSSFDESTVFEKKSRGNLKKI